MEQLLSAKPFRLIVQFDKEPPTLKSEPYPRMPRFWVRQSSRVWGDFWLLYDKDIRVFILCCLNACIKDKGYL